MNKPRIYISSPHPDHLDQTRRTMHDQVIDQIIAAGFSPQEFSISGLPGKKAWNLSLAREVMKECDGAVVLAFTRAFVRVDSLTDGRDIPSEYRGVVPLPSEYNHLEGALAVAFDLPTLIIAEPKMPQRGILYLGGGLIVSKVSVNSVDTTTDVSWLRNDTRFDDWVQDVKKRYDVFIGYCSKADDLAQSFVRELERDFKVMDWARHFRTGRTILEEIDRAARVCRCGIFLFTKDDETENRGLGNDFIPRDNVLLEAGYFIGTRRKDRVAIVRERGTNMPADLGGVIYLDLESRNNIDQIFRQLRSFLFDTLAEGDG